MKVRKIKVTLDPNEIGEVVLAHIASHYNFANESTIERLKVPMKKVMGQLLDFTAVLIQPEEDDLETAAISNYAFEQGYKIPAIQMGCLFLKNIGLSALRDMGYEQWIVVMSKPDGEERLAINLMDGDPLVFLVDCYESGRNWKMANAFMYIESLTEQP